MGPREDGAGSREQKQEEAGMCEREGGRELLPARSRGSAAPGRAASPDVPQTLPRPPLPAPPSAQSKPPGGAGEARAVLSRAAGCPACCCCRAARYALGDAGGTDMCPEATGRCHRDAVGDTRRRHRDAVGDTGEGTRQEDRNPESPQETAAQRG